MLWLPYNSNPQSPLVEYIENRKPQKFYNVIISMYINSREDI